MVLIPIFVVLLCIGTIQAWRKKWKNSLVYLLLAAMSLLTFEFCVQSSFIRFQKAEIDKLHAELLTMKLDVQKENTPLARDQSNKK